MLLILSLGLRIFGESKLRLRDGLVVEELNISIEFIFITTRTEITGIAERGATYLWSFPRYSLQSSLFGSESRISLFPLMERFSCVYQPMNSTTVMFKEIYSSKWNIEAQICNTYNSARVTGFTSMVASTSCRVTFPPS